MSNLVTPIFPVPLHGPFVPMLWPSFAQFPGNLYSPYNLAGLASAFNATMDR
jgi:hypothetical protein